MFYFRKKSEYNSVDVAKYVESIVPPTTLHFSQQTHILNNRADKYLNPETLNKK